MSYFKFILATFIAPAICLGFTGCDTPEIVANQQAGSEEARLSRQVLDDVRNTTSRVADANQSGASSMSSDSAKATDGNKFTNAFGKRFVVSLRVWRDANDLYSTNAELIAVALATREVKLLKDNGITITVPFAELSPHDQAYVIEFMTATRQSPSTTPEIVDRFTSINNN